MGAVPAGNRLTIQFWLKSQTAAAASYASAVSTPGSPLFEHYLTPAAYTARFGATAHEAASVESWLKSAGFTGVSADSGRDYVAGTASVSTIDTALRPGSGTTGPPPASTRAGTGCGPTTARFRCRRRWPPASSGSPAWRTPRR